MNQSYTDAENTGIPAVPALNSTDDDVSHRRELMEEIVWSHRLDEAEEGR